MTSADKIARHLVFDKIDSEKTPNLISYSLKDNANGDSWKEIKVIFNGASEPQTVNIKGGDWKIVAIEGKISPKADLGATRGGKTTIAPYSALILAKEK